MFRAALFLLLTSGHVTFAHWTGAHPSDNTLKSSKCDYLERTDEKQDNAFIMNKLECCMCPKGYRYAGICNATHPNTTQCIPCEEGSYIPYNVHLTKTCLIRPATCRPPFVSVIRSTTERPSCVCRDGMVESNGDCIEEKTSAPIQLTTTASTTMPTTTMPPTNGTTTTKISTISSDERRKTPNIFTLGEKVTGTSVMTPSQDPLKSKTDEKKSATMTGIRFGKDGVEQGSSYGSKFVIIAIVFGAVILTVISVVCWYKKCRKPIELNSKSDSPSESPQTNSFSSLGLEMEDPARRQLVNNRVEEGDIQRSQRFDNQLTSSPLLGCETDGGKAEEPVSSAEVSFISEVLPASNSAGPIMNSPVDGRVEHQVQPQILNDPQGNCQCTRPDCIRKNKDFARNVGRKFGEVLPITQAPRIFRFILAQDNDEQELQNLIDRHKNNVKELVYQLMLLAIRVKGKKLTPNYLLDRIDNADPRLQELYEIIEDEMKEPSMMHPRCSICMQQVVSG